MEYPKYSVLMSLYIKEKPDFLKLAIDSMLSQTVKPDEIVIVEDGPLTQQLYDILDEYENLHQGLFVRVKNETNLGLGLALSKGIEVCRNELIARMDTDDISLDNRCEQQLQYFLKDKDVDIVGGDISEFIGKENNIVAYRKVPINHSEITTYMRKRCPFNHMSTMYKKSAVERAGGYKDLFWNEDYYLWIRMQISGARFANTGTILVKVRTGEDMYARRGGKRYFQSEKYLQKYMLTHGIIKTPTYMSNIIKRWIVQRCLPNRLRGWVFRKFARTHI